MFKPIDKKSLADAVFEQLRERIVRGDISPGEALPAERGLSEMLGVNRGAVREALKRLEQARLIAIQQGGATRVLDYEETAGTDLLAALLMRPDGTVNVEVMRGIMEMRTAIASDIARLGARRASQGQLEALGQVVERMKGAKGDLGALQDLSISFWQMLTEAAQNIAYKLALNSIERSYAATKAVLTQVLADEYGDVDRFQLLLAALRAKDEEEAAYMGRQITLAGEESIQRLLSMMEGASS